MRMKKTQTFSIQLVEDFLRIADDLKMVFPRSDCAEIKEYCRKHIAGKPDAFDRILARLAGWNGQDQTDTADVVPSSVPQSLTAVTAVSDKVTLYWQASNDNRAVAGYRILRNNRPIASTTSTGYIDTGLTPNSTYAYQIIAFDAAGNASAPNAAAVITTVALPPADYS